MKVLIAQFEPWDEHTNMSAQEIDIPKLNMFEGMDINEQWLQVLKSAAGYYIGRLYYDQDMKGYYPYDRDSACYWESRQDAEEALKARKYPIHMW